MPHDPAARPTLRLAADPLHPERSHAAIAEAAHLLQSGGTVAFATETVYGLGADALNPSAVEKIFVAKQRPAWDPLIVHIADTPMLHRVVAQIPEAARLWMEQFWPGPLTMLLPRSASVPDLVTAGRARVGVRMPRHPVALALIRAAATPIAAPSANLFGHVSPTTAAHVLADLDGRIDAVLDGGPAEHGLESTVVDCCEDPCIVYRPGAITLGQLAAVWPRVVMYREPSKEADTLAIGSEHVNKIGHATEASGHAHLQSLPSPGVGLRHYAPRAQLVLIEGGVDQAERLMGAITNEQSGRTGLLLPQQFLSDAQYASLPVDLEVFAWGAWGRPDELAQRLFAGLRALDDAGVTRIVCPVPAVEGVGLALCDRLRKAARPR